MTLEKAKESRGKFTHLIGQTDDKNGWEITDIVIVPDNSSREFWASYCISKQDAAEHISDFPSDSYSLRLAYNGPRGSVDVL